MPLGSRHAAGNYSEVAIASESLGIAQAQVRRTQHHEVGEIDSLSTELYIEPLGNFEILENREVQSLCGRPGNRLQANVAAGRNAESLIQYASVKSAILKYSFGVRPPGGAELPLPV